jgi:HTH-type transcriptional regulator/antitoxin HipB
MPAELCISRRNCNRTFTDKISKRTTTRVSCKRTATGVTLKINSPRDLGAAVRGRRTSLGLSQAEVARRAGVSRPWLSNIEAGKPSAEFGRILRLLDALDLSVHLEVSPEIARTVDLDALLLEYEDR